MELIRLLSVILRSFIGVVAMNLPMAMIPHLYRSRHLVTVLAFTMAILNYQAGYLFISNFFLFFIIPWVFMPTTPVQPDRFGFLSMLHRRRATLELQTQTRQDSPCLAVSIFYVLCLADFMRLAAGAMLGWVGLDKGFELMSWEVVTMLIYGSKLSAHHEIFLNKPDSA